MRSIPILLTLLACQVEAPPPAPPPPSAWVEAAAMDPRTAVPLTPRMAEHQKQNMRDHLRAVQEIVTGLGTSDWPAVEAAAARLGSSPQSAMMCEHMGAGAEGFTERGLAFHTTADGLGLAAGAQDREAVLSALSATLGACTSCHESYRQEVVSESDYQAKTGQAPHGAP